MNPIIITLMLAGVFFQGQEDPEVVQGIAFFEKGDFKNAQRCLFNSIPRARDVAQASWYLSLSNIAISKKADVTEKEMLLEIASGLLENLASSASIYEVAAAIGFNDCVLQTSRIRKLPYLLKANELLKKARETQGVSAVDLMNINKRISHNLFLIAQFEDSPDQSSQSKSNEGGKKQGDKKSQTKSADDKNKGDVSDKDLDNAKGKKTDKKAEGLTDKVQAGAGNLDLVPYRASLQDLTKEDAAKLIKDAAKKVRQAAGEDLP
ncbi:MAG: hypothetical protein NTV50_07615 [Planctomycetota bacterium]|nr:hypothetical protein [Planctomycetota bacterium]